VHAYACPRKLRVRLSLALPVSSVGDSSAASVPRSKDDAGEEPVPKTTPARRSAAAARAGNHDACAVLSHKHNTYIKSKI
jgi:hypothetical protein